MWSATTTQTLPVEQGCVRKIIFNGFRTLTFVHPVPCPSSAHCNNWLQAFSYAGSPVKAHAYLSNLSSYVLSSALGPLTARRVGIYARITSRVLHQCGHSQPHALPGGVANSPGWTASSGHERVSIPSLSAPARTPVLTRAQMSGPWSMS